MPTEKNEAKPKRCRSTFYFEGKQYEAAGKTQKEADQKAALKLAKFKRGEVGISSNMTVKRWAEEWLDIYKKPSLAKKQYDDYKNMIDNVIVAGLEGLKLKSVKDVHLQKIINSKAGWSLDRLSKLKNRINAMFRQAYASRLITHNPAEFLTLPKAENGTHRSITDHEREVFLKVASTHFAGMMFKVMLYCGLRTGEAAALEWRDVDFIKRRIKVSRAMESGTDEIKAPKTAAGIREIPIPDEYFNDLSKIQGEPFEPLFKQPNGKRHTAMSRSRAWGSLKEEMDLTMGAKYGIVMDGNGKERKAKTHSPIAKDLVPYCLRHTYCTDLQNKGVPINVAKYLMGHANISVTAGIYTHISDIAIDSAAEMIDGNNGRNNGSGNQAKRERASAT